MTLLKSNTRIEKINSEPGDSHQDGAQGRVVRPLLPDMADGGYFVEWDDARGLPCYIAPHRIKEKA